VAKRLKAARRNRVNKTVGKMEKSVNSQTTRFSADIIQPQFIRIRTVPKIRAFRVTELDWDECFINKSA
jgi:hypothetical protein